MIVLFYMCAYAAWRTPGGNSQTGMALWTLRRWGELMTVETACLTAVVTFWSRPMIYGDMSFVVRPRPR